MRRLILTAAFATIGFTLPRAEESEYTHRNTVAVHPMMSLLVSGAHVTWEHGLSEGYWSTEVPLFFGMEPGQALNLGAGLGVRRYLDAGAVGWYLSPQVDFIDFNSYGNKAFHPNQRNFWIAESARIGYKKELGRLSLDGGLGVGNYNDFHAEDKYDFLDTIGDGWGPMFSLSAGWRF